MLGRNFIISILIQIILTMNINAQNFAGMSNGEIKNVDIIIGTFLGNWQRNYYGNSAPSKLDIIWKVYLGKGKTVISKKIGEKEWAGSGWTGQPLLIREDSKLYLIQGAFDHNLKKIDAATGKIIWEYKFEDVIKGTGTIWSNNNAQNLNESIIILQGSRRGLSNNLYSPLVPSFRAISYFSGEEFWRLNVKLTPSYSRDVDASAIVLNDTAYIGLENSTFIAFNPNFHFASKRDNIVQPKIYQEINLYSNSDIRKHGGNLVVESSPCLLNNHIYITAGSGHVYGYNLKSREIDWDFYIGSDMDGSPVVTEDSCLLVTVEKQYIKGHGGVFKLNPSKPADKSVVWYFPTEDDSVETWEGGIVGSVSINDKTRKNEDPFLCAFIGIDGYLYVVDHTNFASKKDKVYGPNNLHKFSAPKLVFKDSIGPSISTPVIIGNKIIAAGYKGLYLYEFDKNLKFTLLDKKIYSSFESTPIAYNNRIYIGSRDGNLYCFGNLEQ